MPAGATDDAGDPSPLRGADRSVGTALEIAAGGKAQPKARTKRQRPTFDDGLVTRVFKFPSKAYPRSSYYVTSTEIIIRIKKARKKWKLVVPKKRVAAYRTNRWFAKPRWVEIELTYTQASKLGLVEPRTPSTEVTNGISAEQQVAGHPIVDSDHTLPGGSASEPTSTWQRQFELDPNVDQPGRPLNTGDVDFVSVDEDDTSCRDRFLTAALECLHCRRCPLPTPTFAAGSQGPQWRRRGHAPTGRHPGPAHSC